MRCDCLAAASARSERGFSLVELLVVVAILALAAAVMPRTFSGLGAVRLHAAADDLVDRLKQLRLDAVTSGRTTEMLFDSAALAYTISGDPGSRRILNGITAIVVETPSMLAADKSARVRFFPDGSTTGATVRLTQEARSATIVVDWLTGRIRRRD